MILFIGILPLARSRFWKPRGALEPFFFQRNGGRPRSVIIPFIEMFLLLRFRLWRARGAREFFSGKQSQSRSWSVMVLFIEMFPLARFRLWCLGAFFFKETVAGRISVHGETH